MSNTKTPDDFIEKYMNGKTGLTVASHEYFAKEGRVTGSMLVDMKVMLKEYASQQNQKIGESWVREKAKADKLERQNRAYVEALKWTLEFIDAIPKDIQLPIMPGFDRDYVNSLIQNEGR